MVKRHVSDPRLQRVFTFQSLYAGVAPRNALAVYAEVAQRIQATVRLRLAERSL